MALKVTIDSSEPLADALRVIGAMYDVTVVGSAVEAESAELSAPSRKARRSSSSRVRQVRARATMPKGRTVSNGGAGLASQPATGAVSSAELRLWAAEHGYSVSGRGRIPAAVVAAYREANIN